MCILIRSSPELIKAGLNLLNNASETVPKPCNILRGPGMHLSNN